MSFKDLIRALLAWTVVLPAAGCATGPSASPFVITTDASQYVLPAQGLAVVHATATNHGDQTLYEWSGGFGWEFQSQLNGAWQPPAACMIGAGLPGVLVSVPVGQSVSDSVFVCSAGTYRVHVFYGTDSSNASPYQQGARQAASNRFTVHR